MCVCVCVCVCVSVCVPHHLLEERHWEASDVVWHVGLLAGRGGGGGGRQLCQQLPSEVHTACKADEYVQMYINVLYIYICIECVCVCTNIYVMM